MKATAKGVIELHHVTPIQQKRINKYKAQGYRMTELKKVGSLTAVYMRKGGQRIRISGTGKIKLFP